MRTKKNIKKFKRQSKKLKRMQKGGNFVIPKIIHQTWKSTELPENYKKWSGTWKLLNKDWKYMFWSDEDLRNLVVNDYPELLEMYDGFNTHIKRVDMARYLFLKKYGGLYVDMDFECLKPIDKLLENHSCVIGWEDKRYLCNAFMASTQNHKVWDNIIDYIKSLGHKHTKCVMGYPGYCTGNVMITDRILEYNKNKKNKNKVWLCPTKYIYPYSWYEKHLENNEFPNAYACHRWTATWAKK